MNLPLKNQILSFVFILLILFSCKKDDEAMYTDLQIITEADLVEVLQDQKIVISVLSNDVNIPISGSLHITSTVNGEASILDNGTTNDPSDDTIEYTPNANFTGSDRFTYTICSLEGDCVTEDVTISVLTASQVVFNLAEMPYPKLSDYNFFEGDLADQIPNFGVLPYKPISSLFTDYALKKRFIWMPNNKTAQYAGDHDALDFPVGTLLIKGFYYDNVQPENNRQNIETRVMIRKEEGWVFANYIWNESQTEAFFNLDGGFANVTWNQNGTIKNTNYRIPAGSQCFTCHESSERPIPIGLKPQNLNGMYPYTDGSKNQLQKFIEVGYLEEDLPQDINTVVDWQDTSQSLELRMRSYVDINCAHCHSPESYCHYRPIRFQFKRTEDLINLGVCVDPETPIPPYSKIVDPGNIENSLLYFRLNTTQEQYRMPLLGRTLIHEEHIALVEEWIESLNMNCE